MSTHFTRAPHIEGSSQPAHPAQAPNAALLVDFDNVTMGMRSDLSRELKTLLGSEIIRGKVTVQRAYADWRRYPQYIVPLSEASIDLIFAPAYGSSKKNATDIRMAIDGMELVFTRPEIGTYILLTGDSDFSSLVLKLKEYGKYVIGVGIQESSSDILVQNCDEYYSYTTLSGLRKTSEATRGGALDPWLLVEKAVEQMVKRGDVMRSDRLKQVMLELDPGFEEKSFGFSKFSRFLTEAAQKGLLRLRKLENGQYEILDGGNGRGGRERGGDSRARKDESRRTESRRSEPRRSEGRGASGRAGGEPKAAQQEESASAPAASRAPAGDRSELEPAYDLLRRAIRELADDQGGGVVRDSDVKRRMLALDSAFDEAELGFGKFSKFLRQAHDHEVVDLRKGENGQYHLALRDGAGGAAPASAERVEVREEQPGRAAAATEPEGAPEKAEKPAEPGAGAESAGRESRRLRPRLSTRRRGGGDGPPPLFEGQVVDPGGKAGGTAERGVAGSPELGEEPSGDILDPGALRLPTGRASTVKYLANSYRGVGEKTAEMLVDALGDDLFRVLQENPSKVEELLPPGRAEKVLDGWKEDFARRRSRMADDGAGR